MITYTFFLFLGYLGMFAAIAYYFKYIVRNEMMTSVAVTITTIVPIFSMLIAARLNAKYSKRNISIVGTLIQILGSLIIWIGGSNVAIVFLGVGLMGFGMGFRSNMYFSMLADVTIPEQMEGHTVRAVLNTGATDIWNTDNPQIMAYVNGRFAATLDMNHQLSFCRSMPKQERLTNWLFMRIPVRMQARLPVRISSAWSWQSTGKRRRDSIMTCRLSMKLRIFCRRTIYPGSRALKHWKDA